MSESSLDSLRPLHSKTVRPPGPPFYASLCTLPHYPRGTSLAWIFGLSFYQRPRCSWISHTHWLLLEESGHLSRHPTPLEPFQTSETPLELAALLSPKPKSTFIRRRLCGCVALLPVSISTHVSASRKLPSPSSSSIRYLEFTFTPVAWPCVLEVSVLISSLESSVEVLGYRHPELLSGLCRSDWLQSGSHSTSPSPWFHPLTPCRYKGKAA